jgi:hypothetical protein
MPYYVTIQYNGGTRSDCEPLPGRWQHRSVADHGRLTSAAVRYAAAKGGKANLISNGRGKLIARFNP